MNPDLGTAGQTQTAVAPIPALTAPFPTVLAAEQVYFKSTIPDSSMHRQDGKRLAFVRGVCKTNVIADIIYLRAEIDNGNQYISEATPAEIEAIEMQLNPKAAIEKQVRAELEPKIRADLEAQIRREMAQASGVKTAETSPDKSATLLAGVDGGVAAPRKDVRETINAVNTSGASAANANLARLASSNSNKPMITPVSTADLSNAAESNGAPASK